MSNYEKEIFIIAWKYWNENIYPPKERIAEMWDFINDNPSLFGGATAQ